MAKNGVKNVHVYKWIFFAITFFAKIEEIFSAAGQNRILWSDMRSFPGFYTRSANFEWDNNQPLGGPFINSFEL